MQEVVAENLPQIEIYMEIRTLKIILYLFICSTIFACNTVDERSPSNSGENPTEFSDDWIIPKDEVINGGPGLDGIPSIDDPNFASVDEIEYVVDHRLVTGIKIGDKVRAYPHQVLDWHEIVNDHLGDSYFVITYCPLTGTDIAWKRNSVTEFGVSGLLFRNNLILYDRASYSRYSQMQLRGVNGPMAGTDMETIPVIQTSWKTWKETYPKSEVLTTNTGIQRNYEGYAYSSEYLDEDSATLFPIQNRDNRLPRKKRVHGIIRGVAYEDSEVRVYVIDDFGAGIHLIEDTFGGFDIIIAGSSEHNFAMSYRRELPDGTTLQFEAVQDSLPVIMKDQEGNHWDIFGIALEGPRKGARLEQTISYTGYWFAWAEFFTNLEIYP